MEEEIAKYFTDSYDFYEKIQKDDIRVQFLKLSIRILRKKKRVLKPLK